MSGCVAATHAVELQIFLVLSAVAVAVAVPVPVVGHC